MTLKADRFITANGLSPVVYLGIGDHTVTYRLADNTSWTFSRREARELGQPRLAHLVTA
jgi:hypothetical protein